MDQLAELLVWFFFSLFLCLPYLLIHRFNAFYSHVSKKNSQNFQVIYKILISSVTQSCRTCCDHVNRSTLGLLPITSSGSPPNPRPSSRWCHPATSSSGVPFFSCPQSFPASGSFLMSQHVHRVAKVLEFQLQHQSFQWTPRTDLL